MDSFDDFDFDCIFSFTRKKSISKSKSVKSHRSTDTEDYMQIPVVIPQTVGTDPPRPPPPPPPIAPITFIASAPTSSTNGDTLASTKTNSSNIPIPPQPPQDTATRKQQQPLSAISIQDLNSVQVSDRVWFDIIRSHLLNSIHSIETCSCVVPIRCLRKHFQRQPVAWACNACHRQMNHFCHKKPI